VYPICRCENNYVCLFYSALLITYLSTGPVSLIFHLALDQNAAWRSLALEALSLFFSTELQPGRGRATDRAKPFAVVDPFGEASGATGTRLPR